MADLLQYIDLSQPTFWCAYCLELLQLTPTSTDIHTVSAATIAFNPTFWKYVLHNQDVALHH